MKREVLVLETSFWDKGVNHGKTVFLYQGKGYFDANLLMSVSGNKIVLKYTNHQANVAL